MDGNRILSTSLLPRKYKYQYIVTNTVVNDTIKNLFVTLFWRKMNLSKFIIPFLFCSCSLLQEPDPYIDPLVKPAVDKFFDEGRKRGYYADPSELCIRLVHGLEKRTGATGQSDKLYRLIELDYDVIKFWHEKGYHYHIERLVLHELGHNYLGRTHTAEFSIMNTETYNAYTDSDSLRDILIDELFLFKLKRR